MRLHIFQSDKGDCLLLESGDGRFVLCDGGMSSSMTGYVRGELAKLRQQGKVLDYAYISHIDQDHISGVLRLLQDELEWRIYDFQKSNGNNKAKKPKVPRPPEIHGILHNAFRDQVPNNVGDIEDLLAAAAPALFATGIPEFVEIGADLGNIALSIPEAIKVSRLASAELLNIPVNRLPNTTGAPKLLFFRKKPQSFSIGTMKFTIVGPTVDELDNLREGWNNWLRENEESVRKIRDQMRKNVERFSSGVNLTAPFDLRDWNGVPDYKNVTAPNIASLMFMVEENDKRILLTGDSQQDIILKGLRLTGALNGNGLHVDVLKAQHHGSENNFDADFCRQVSADHYVFCGNGEHGNPELRVIRMIYESRLGVQAKRALAPAADGRPFTFWFSTASKESPEFVEAENLAKSLASKSKGKLKVKFNTGNRITLSV
jgi:hypothetical protein